MLQPTSMKPAQTLIRLSVVLAVLSTAIYPGENKATIPAGSSVYVDAMDGFGQFIIAAITKMNRYPLRRDTQLIPVLRKEDADYQITGSSDSEKAGWAKTIVSGGHSKEEASVMLLDKQGKILWAYSVHKFSSF